MNVLTATGQKEWDLLIQKFTQTPIPPVAYREGVVKVAEQQHPEIVLLSAFLGGHQGIEEVLYQLRRLGARIIVLIGHTQPRVIREKWMPLGIYDFITDPVTEEKLQLALEHPATLGMAEEHLQMIETGQEADQGREKKSFSSFKKQRKREHQAKSESPKPDVSTLMEQNTSGSVTSDVWDFNRPAYLMTEQIDAELSKNQSQPIEEKSGDNHSKDPEKNDFQKPETWGFHAAAPYRNQTLPSSVHNMVVLSPAATGKTYVAMNLAAILSKQGRKTELVSFEESGDIWTYFGLPPMKGGSPKDLPDLNVTTFSNMGVNLYYRVIDLPYRHWDVAQDWQNAMFLYVNDMDIEHRNQVQREQTLWENKNLLRILNRFVPNTLDVGQEQKIRMEADIVFQDRPANYLAMRFGQAVAITEQAAAREFELAIRIISGAFSLSAHGDVRR